MSAPRDEAGVRVEILFSEVDRRVEVRLDDDAPEDSGEHLADEVLHVLAIDDPDEAESTLRTNVADMATVRRLQ